MKDVSKQMVYVDIQDYDISEEDRTIMFDAIRELDIVKANDVCYILAFEDFLNEDDDGKRFWSDDYQILFDTLKKYVPEEKLMSKFIFNIWW